MAGIAAVRSRLPRSPIGEWWRWRARRYAAPSPSSVKRSVLERNGIPGSTWVETGTYLGETTRFLADRFPKVVTIEPEPELHRRARERFAGTANVELVHGTSEEAFGGVVAALSGDLSFWLDGHFSDGVTYKGTSDTPVLVELDVIAGHLDRLGEVATLVDDVRLFGNDPAYPSLDHLVDWHRAHGFTWHVEHDVFVGRRRPS